MCCMDATSEGWQGGRSSPSCHLPFPLGSRRETQMKRNEMQQVALIDKARANGFESVDALVNYFIAIMRLFATSRRTSTRKATRKRHQEWSDWYNRKED